MNGFELPSGESLAVSIYEAPERKPAPSASGIGQVFSCKNLYVKNFPHNDFSEEDLMVSSISNFIFANRESF